MNIVEVRKIVGDIKAQLFKKSNSYSIGMLKSSFRGSGLQFKEHRQYTHGDDVRFIDWKILAKTGDPFVKTFEEERNVQIAVVIDTGPSMLYGWEKVSKLQAALEITCMLYLLAGETNDFIHAVLLGDQIIDVPVGNGEKGIVQFISSLSRNGLIDENGKLKLDFHQIKKNNVDEMKAKEVAIKKHIARNREVIILSDWLEWLDMESYNLITANKRSHCFRIVAPLDLAEDVPISLKVGQKALGGVKKFKVDGPLLDTSIKRIKNLDLTERYLDQFVREMI